MKAKYFVTIILAIALIPQALFAQQSKSDPTVEFKPHFYIHGQGGAGYTIGEAKYMELFSPALQGSLGFQFSPVFGVRLIGAGIQGKGHAISNGIEGYSFNYLEGGADLTLNLANLFGGYKHNRVVSPYLFLGGAGILGFRNKANNVQSVSPSAYFGYLWKGKTLFPAGRAGLGAEFRLSDIFAITLEGNCNVISDRFNSKRADNPDFQFNALAGLKINFGKPYRPSAAYLAAIAAEEAEAARLAAEEAARLAAEKEAAEKAAAEAARLAAEEEARRAAEKAAAEKAARDAAMQRICTFFDLDSSVISAVEAAKLDDYIQWLEENPSVKLSITGYADVQTGSRRYNMAISKRRTAAVKEYLVEHGVAEDRIDSDYKGDTVQPFEENDLNRVVISLVK